MEHSKEESDTNLKETTVEKFRRHMLGILFKLRHPRRSLRSEDSSPEFVDQPEEGFSIDVLPVQGSLLHL